MYLDMTRTEMFREHRQEHKSNLGEFEVFKSSQWSHMPSAVDNAIFDQLNFRIQIEMRQSSNGCC